MTSGETIDEENLVSVLVLGGPEPVTCALTWRSYPDCSYSIDLDGPAGPVAARGRDLFQALQEIRLELEPGGWSIAVQGARKDTYPSGMVRDMVGARRVYVLHTGRDMAKEDLVNIFAEAAAAALGTVEQQKNNYQEWRDSVRRR
ncbi:hypothetical protein [Actinocrispum wychmicini]|uniref:Uncharacterized protein n=1 Tax=Actinocrispum wychmicini TaxID=1213861 RepID=A0A4R2JGB7_9PSEU|nr:hypothetical protein [Actinocrispum wychmicini]TCO55918.1 hypothetical protein EV192_107341 [Actinocrispum wychmicini]